MKIDFTTTKIIVQSFRENDKVELVINGGEAGFLHLFLTIKQNNAIMRVIREMDDKARLSGSQESIAIGMVCE